MDTTLIFAKKTTTWDPQYINIETPTKDPTTYGTPDTDLTVLEKSGLKFITANDDSVMSPGQQFVASTTSSLNISIDFDPISEGGITGFFGQGDLTAGLDRMQLAYSDPTLSFEFRTGSTIQTINATVNSVDLFGNIQIVGNGSNIEIWLNGVKIADELVTISTDLTGIVDDLYFGSRFWGGTTYTYSNILITGVTINNHEWDFPELTGSTTTNSQSVISTLSSSVSTEAMWQGGVVPSTIQYEFDSLAMLIYNGTGSTVSFSGKENQHYIFAIFNIVNDVYSNPTYALGQTRVIHPLETIMAKSDRIQWAIEDSYPCGTDYIMVVVSAAAITDTPTGLYSAYETGVTTDYSTSTSYLNGVDDTGGTVLFVGLNTVDRVAVSNLPLDSYVNVYVNRSTDWSIPVSKVIDIR